MCMLILELRVDRQLNCCHREFDSEGTTNVEYYPEQSGGRQRVWSDVGRTVQRLEARNCDISAVEGRAMPIKRLPGRGPRPGLPTPSASRANGTGLETVERRIQSGRPCRAAANLPIRLRRFKLREVKDWPDLAGMELLQRAPHQAKRFASPKGTLR